MTGLRFPEFNDDLRCLVDVEDRVVDLTPVHQVFHLNLVDQLVVTQTTPLGASPLCLQTQCNCPKCAFVSGA